MNLENKVNKASLKTKLENKVASLNELGKQS